MSGTKLPSEPIGLGASVAKIIYLGKTAAEHKPDCNNHAQNMAMGWWYSGLGFCISIISGLLQKRLLTLENNPAAAEGILSSINAERIFEGEIGDDMVVEAEGDFDTLLLSVPSQQHDKESNVAGSGSFSASRALDAFVGRMPTELALVVSAAQAGKMADSASICQRLDLDRAANRFVRLRIQIGASGNIVPSNDDGVVAELNRNGRALSLEAKANSRNGNTASLEGVKLWGWLGAAALIAAAVVLMLTSSVAVPGSRLHALLNAIGLNHHFDEGRLPKTAVSAGFLVRQAAAPLEISARPQEAPTRAQTIGGSVSQAELEAVLSQGNRKAVVLSDGESGETGTYQSHSGANVPFGNADNATIIADTRSGLKPRNEESRTKLVNQPTAVEGMSYSEIVIDAQSGRVLHAENANVPHQPAGLAKLMTLYMAFDALRSGQIEMDQAVRVSARAASTQGASLKLQPGMSLTVEQAIIAIAVKSANDAAVALSEELSGSEDQFAQAMTKQAHVIGMNHTTFWNSSGLPDPRQSTTAADQGILMSRLAREFPLYYQNLSRPSFTMWGQVISNHNAFLKFYPGADGSKTGWTETSGYNMTTSAVRSGSRLIGVVLGAGTDAERDARMAALLDRGFLALSGGSMSTASDASRGTARISLSVRPMEASWIIQSGHSYSDERVARAAAMRLVSMTAAGKLEVKYRSLNGKPAWSTQVSFLTPAEALATCSELASKEIPCRLLRPNTVASDAR